MKIERKIYNLNSSLALVLPKDIAKYLELETDSKVEIEDCENDNEEKYIIIRKKE